ncbi:MAG: hypothetical protein JWQ89_703 [Devosia sp.]|uniref:hypothetical protein n=1 Tax=Devosia sp. TaxID=1871048 RepID=UPI002617BD9D|nr:hypothetical protein [Devosia sp.]MDB5538976.1 hypothetical protein [Devosia sp.]
MITQTFLGGRPGQRIDDYRNSTPRFVKVLGVGDSARAIIERFNESHRDNIITTGALNPMRLEPMDEPVNGISPNAVIVVYQKGEHVAFPFLTDRTASMLSLIVLETPEGGSNVEADRKVRQIQAVADLYVTTSDTDFVNELVDNLAS